MATEKRRRQVEAEAVEAVEVEEVAEVEDVVVEAGAEDEAAEVVHQRKRCRKKLKVFQTRLCHR